MTSKYISRRETLGLMGIGLAGMVFGNAMAGTENHRHIITLSFDDGFEKSSLKTAELFSKYKLHACINIIATAHLPDFKLPNEYHNWKVGDFSLWNELKSQGHEIMPHGLIHEDYTALSLEESKKSILKCLDIFTQNLNGFKSEQAIFNFPFNRSNSEIEDWLSGEVRAFRTGGSELNPLPYQGQKKLTCISQGPENINSFLESVINKFLEGPDGWLIFNTHGLDGEGWGPLTSGFLDELLDRLTKINSLQLLTITEALDTIKY